MEETTIITEGAGQVEKTYTEKEFQSEVDKRVKQALDTQSKKMKEAERLAAMCNYLNLDPLHFFDVVEDAVSDF